MMWNWIKQKVTNVLTSIGQGQLAEAEANRAASQAVIDFLSPQHKTRTITPPTIPPNAIKMTGTIWEMDPQTQIVTRMIVVEAPDDKFHGFKLIPTNEKAFIPGGHAKNTQHLPIFHHRQGHRVATLDAGHGVIKPSGDYDNGSQSVGSLKAGAHVMEAAINLHFAQDAAVEFARNNWDTIITHGSRRRSAGNGFDPRIAAANAAGKEGVYISIHGDQRLGDPKDRDPKRAAAARERLAVQAKAENIKAQHGDLSHLLNAHEQEVLQEIDSRKGLRVYIDKRIAPNDHSLDFGQYLSRPANRFDLIHDGNVRRPGYEMINGLKIHGPLSLLLEPGAIDIAQDEVNMRSRNYRQAFAKRLVEKTEEFLFQQKQASVKKAVSAHPKKDSCGVEVPLNASDAEVDRQLRTAEDICSPPSVPKTIPVKPRQEPSTSRH